MLSRECLKELRNEWLPNITDGGLDRLIDLLRQGSPLLIHGCFTRSVPMGCLATHIAWHHPRTAQRNEDAGIIWLNRVAGIQPSLSHVIREWDGRGANSVEVRNELLAEFCAERDRRQAAPAPMEERELVSV